MPSRRKVILGGSAAAAVGAAAVAFATSPDYEGLAQSIRRPAQGGGNGDFAWLVHHAAVAANSHNTQPWLFSGDRDAVTIRPDFARALPQADPTHHHIFASLGCAAENLAIAARAVGRSAEIAYDSQGDGAVAIALGNAPTVPDPLFGAIAQRQCTRSAYDGRAVPADDLKRLEAALDGTGCRVVFVNEKDRIEQLLEMILAANTAQVENPAFRAELRDWIRFGPRSAVARRDGLYSGCSGNPTLPDFIGRAIFDFVFTVQSENDRYASQVRSSAGLAVFVTDADDPAHWVAAGRGYQRFALASTALGMRHAFLNQPIEIAQKRTELAGWLGGGSPDLVVRFGYAPPMPYSLRRPVEDVIV